MAYSVDNIIPINLILTPSGLGYANFSSAFAFGTQAELAAGVSFDVDTYRDYATLSDVLEDFKPDSEIAKIATRWFANIPKPPQISVYMWDSEADSPAEVAAKADNSAWRYWYFFPVAVTDVEANAIALADWADASTHGLPITTSAADVVDPQSETDIASVLKAKGNRHAFVGYVPASAIATDPSQAYAMVQLAAAFHKFRPDGLRTAITGEYQVLPGVIGASLTTTAYNALKAKNVVFFTQIELQGSVDASRVINSKSMSSYGEFMDDVVNLDVLRNHLQVDGYNYIANAGTKRPLTPSGYAGLLATLDATCKRFYDNGVLGEASYMDLDTAETRIAKYGYVIRSNPEDVFRLSQAQKRARQFPNTSILAILARAGHTAEITVNVE